ncbi:MAG: redoxin domain-containing protein [Acidimicrobiia bacterium]|nr:redoxin domain-containing protein [Acidimicrobiia bacterium]
MALDVGQPAPTFELTDQDKNQVSLDDLKGKRTLIVFIPFPFTGICDGEACAIRDGLGGLEDLDANVVVITAHSVASNAKWAQEYGFTFPILSDYWPHGEVTKAYDNFNEDRGVAWRASYVLDADGVIRDVIATDSLGVAREHELQMEALAAV